MKVKSQGEPPGESSLAARLYGTRPSHGARRLTAGPLTLMTVGGIMGSGLFLAAGQAIRLAGPAIAISFAIGVTIMALEVALLAEMAAADPRRGSFLTFAREALGPAPAFIGGWIFWFSSILNLAAEATGGAIFTRLWWPSVPVWVFSMGYAALIVGLNFLPVKNFSRVESGMSIVKVVVTLLFIITAALAIFHFLPTRVPVGVHLWTVSGFFPRGWMGVAAAMVLVLFSMSGTGVLGLAAPDVKNPEHTVGATIRNTVVTIYVLYVASALGITGLVLWSKVPPSTVSPFVYALSMLPWPLLATIFNVVILVAVLSAMNAGLFATNRVLATLGRTHDAPRIVARGSADTPRMANAITGVGLIAAAGLAYLLPKTAYLYLVTATGFQALFVWLLIVVTEIYYRPRLEKEHGPLRFKVPGHPWTAVLAVVLILAVIATAPLAPHEVVALGIGVAATALAALAYLPIRANRQRQA
jgi:AAT family amino acid transporter